MNCTKVKGSFNDYRLELSYGELEAIRQALEREHSGPLADELFAGISWSLDRLPRPGEDQDDDKDGKSAAGVRSAANDLRTPDELEDGPVSGPPKLSDYDDGLDRTIGAPAPRRPVSSQDDLDRELPEPPGR